jgi:tetratricopeptide (TPR) repeat protein
VRRAALTLAVLLGCAHGGAGGLTPLEQAKVAIDEGRPAEAIPALEDAHRAHPDDLDLARALVEAYVKAGRSTELETRLRARNDGVARYMLGLAEFADPGTVEKAIDELRAAAELLPRSAEVHYRLGLALVESERFEPALPPLQRAVQLEPAKLAVQLPLARALARTGHRDEAIAALRTFVEGHPAPAEVKTARALMDEIADPFAGVPEAARARLDQGIKWLNDVDVPQEAIGSFEEVLRDFPDLPAVHSLLGLAYERIDDAGRAIEEFKRAIELSPKIGKNWLYAGQLYLSHQRFDQAQDAFEKAIALNPLLDEAYLHLGDFAVDRHDLATARKMFGILADLEPDQIPPKGKLALAEQLAGDYAAADHTLRQVVDKDPDNVEFTLRLGLVNAERAAHSHGAEKKTATEEAQKWLRKVLDAQPDNAIASRALAGLSG